MKNSTQKTTELAPKHTLEKKKENIKTDFIVSNIDSKTKGFERFADCFEFANRPPGTSINISMIGDRRYRI